MPNPDVTMHGLAHVMCMMGERDTALLIFCTGSLVATLRATTHDRWQNAKSIIQNPRIPIIRNPKSETSLYLLQSTCTVVCNIPITVNSSLFLSSHECQHDIYTSALLPLHRERLVFSTPNSKASLSTFHQQHQKYQL